MLRILEQELLALNTKSAASGEGNGGQDGGREGKKEEARDGGWVAWGNDEHCVRFCGLVRRPGLREWADFIEWANRGGVETNRKSGSEKAASSAEEVLKRLDARERFQGGLESSGRKGKFRGGEGDGRGSRAALEAVGEAAERGYQEVVRELLRMGVAPDGTATRLNHEPSPYARALEHAHNSIAEMLLAAGSSPPIILCICSGASVHQVRRTSNTK